MACCSCGGMYIHPLKYRWPLVMYQLSSDKQGNRRKPRWNASMAWRTKGLDWVED